jgi:hypothetical protein
VFYYFSPDQAARVHEVLNLMDRIPTVVAAQLKEPYNNKAGSDLIPKEYYYNVVAWYL